MKNRVFNLTIDEQSNGSLSLLQELEMNAENIQHVKNGLWVVEGSEDQISEITDAYPDAVMKVEVMS